MASGFIAERSNNLQPTATAGGRVRTDPRNNFMFFYDPKDWVMNSEAQLVPTVVHVSKQPGCGSVTTRGDFRPELFKQQERGRIPIPHEVLGGEHDYVQVFRNHKGRKIHVSIFQAPSVGAGGEVFWSHDAEAWGKFLLFLKRSGIVKAPEPLIIQGILKQYRLRLQSKMGREPSGAGARMDAHQKQVRYLEKCLDVLEDELAASVAHYGEPVSAGRGVISDALAALDSLVNDEDEPSPARSVLAFTAEKPGKAQETLDLLSDDGDGDDFDPQAFRDAEE